MAETPLTETAAAQTTPDQTEPPLSFEEDDEAKERPLVATGELPVGVGLTIPYPGASPLEDRLARANAAARAASLKRLAGWFPGYDFEDAAQNVDARRFAVISLGQQLVDHLNGEQMVDRLLFEHGHLWGLGGISFSHGDVKGHQPPPPYARISAPNNNLGYVVPGGLAKALDERWTAIVNGADQYDPALGEVVLNLGRAIGCPVNTNIYISYGPSKGFGAHWDNHDTIIVPVRGSKRWALLEPHVLSAERPWIDPDTSDRPLWEGVIEPGMALVIPRGWGHRVDGSDDLSIHCTIGLARLETHEMLERVAFEAGFWPMLRADTPYDVREPATSYGGSVYDQPQGFARTIAEVATPELVERAIASHRARIVRRPYPSFGDVFRGVALRNWAGLKVRLVSPAGIMLHSETDEAAVFAFNNRAVQVLTEALEAFLALADAEPMSVSDLPHVGSGGDEDLRPEFASQLVATGMATVER